MTDVVEKRTIIQQEEVDAESGITEDLMFRVGETTNFIAKRQYDTHQFDLNRFYRKGINSDARDGIFPVLFDMEIVGITVWNRVNGTSGTTTFDLQWLSESGVVEGSLLSTKTSMTTGVGNNAYYIKNLLTDTVLTQPASGFTEPVFSKTEFDAGDAIFLNIDDAMENSADAAVLLHFRPR